MKEKKNKLPVLMKISKDGKKVSQSRKPSGYTLQIIIIWGLVGG